MLKLRHLFNNLDLSLMLLKNWNFDETSLDLLQNFRISANAIYPFRQKEAVCFLRFCPTTEKQKGNLAAELEFIGYLRGKGYPALEPLPSYTGDFLIEKITPWGEYYASVFKRVAGEQLSKIPLDDEKLLAYGAALGQLHALSSEYTQPKIRRWTYIDVFNWMEEFLRGLASEKIPLIELELLRKYFAALPIHPDRYGLIHYDFELDNVFYDEATKSCSVIDFDDAMYHWYLMDIAQALDSLKDETPTLLYPEKEALFIRGYRSQFALDDDLIPTMPIFRRFAKLYGYTRVIRAIQERWEHEPEWLVALRQKLEGILVRDAELFGSPI